MSAPVRRALVTGVSSGIGAAVASELLAQGWQVVGVSRSAPPINHPRLAALPADLSNPAAIAGIAADCGPIHALVHAAGLLRVGRIEDMDFATGETMWRLHVDTAARLVQALVPGMNEGGSVVLLGSRVANGAPGRALYAASKAALTGLARSFAAELAPRGITVNVVAPGATETPMLRAPSRTQVRPKLPPIGRFVAPEEVAALCAYLLSPLARAITGQQIVICGGASL